MSPKDLFMCVLALAIVLAGCGRASPTYTTEKTGSSLKLTVFNAAGEKIYSHTIPDAAKVRGNLNSRLTKGGYLEVEHSSGRITSIQLDGKKIRRK